MASVNDIGAITDPLSAPLFGGGAGWAAAIRDALNGSDVTVNARIASHAAAADPHPQYLQTATADSRYSLLAHTHPGVYDPAGTAAAAMSAHTADADPHPQYLTAAEATAPSAVAAVDVSLAAGAAGTAVVYARGDHVHKVPTTTNAPNAVSAAAGAAGTSANVARHDHTHRVSVANPVALGAAIAQGTSNDLARADHVHPFPTAANVGAEAAGAVAAHAGAADPHPGYQREVEKGAVNGYASLGADGKVPSAQLPPSGGGIWQQPDAPAAPPALPVAVNTLWVDTDEVAASPLTEALADARYANVAGDIFTGTVTFQAAPRIQSADNAQLVLNNENREMYLGYHPANSDQFFINLGVPDGGGGGATIVFSYSAGRWYFAHPMDIAKDLSIKNQLLIAKDGVGSFRLQAGNDGTFNERALVTKAGDNSLIPLKVGDPTQPDDAATKNYVDTNRQTIAPPAMNAGWSGTITIYKVGRVVTVYFNVQKATAPAAWEAFATMPAGCRPKEFVYGACVYSSSGGGPYWISIGSGGQIQVVGWTTWPTNTPVTGTLTFIEGS